MPTMKRNGECLIDSVGREWFRGRVVGAYMLRNGQVLKLIDVHEEGDLACTDMQGHRVRVDKRELKGFAQLAYPQLGYRAVGDKIYYLTRRQNYKRGLRRESVAVSQSLASRALEERFRVGGADREAQLMESVFLPNYGTAEQLDEMIAGDRLGVVLSHDLMVEPSVVEGDDDYVVYMRERPCGRMNADRRFKWYAPEYKIAAQRYLGNYGVHE